MPDPEAAMASEGAPMLVDVTLQAADASARLWSGGVPERHPTKKRPAPR